MDPLNGYGSNLGSLRYQVAIYHMEKDNVIFRDFQLL